MKKFDLDAILKKARLPEIPGESLEMFPRRMAARLQRDDRPARPARRSFPHLAWAFGLAVCAVMTFGIGHWRGRVESGTARENDSLASLKFVHETLGMFPNQVRAIVENEQGVSLILSDKADLPASSPLYVRICDGKHCSSCVTFSGQEIQMAGQRITVLADARGGIILEGNTFAWSNTGRNEAGGRLKIEARNLGPATL